MGYGYRKQLLLPFGAAVARVRQTLADEGFGIITEIDVKKAMKEKLGLAYDDYVILGACNPTFADRALKAEKEIGLLLPCNVILYKDNGAVFVSAIAPMVAMSVVDNPTLVETAQVVEERLKRAVDAA